MERLASDDDLATRREEEFRERALRAAVAPRARAEPGTCTNCGEPCLPQAVYCDAECRADHEARERTLGRQQCLPGARRAG